MKTFRSSLFVFWAVALVGTLCAPIALAQEKSSTMLVLAKDAGGTMTRTSFVFTVRANASCDQTGEAFPDGSQLVASDVSFNTDGNGIALVFGSVQLKAVDGSVLQTLTLRGTYGINPRRDNPSCKTAHLEATLEPVPTFAPVNAPQIALAHLAADLLPEAAGPLPTFRAKLDGIVTTPIAMRDSSVTINAEKTGYGDNETIVAIIVNDTAQPVTTYDLKSYCSIVTVQRQVGAEWENITDCFVKRAVLPTTIAAGETKRVVLEPGENANPLKEAGTYRLLFDYFVGSGASQSSQSIRTSSATFRVNAMPTRASVKLQIDHMPRLIGEGFSAQLINDTDDAIQTSDHKSECGILQVQKREGTEWVNVADCQSMRKTRLITIEPRQRFSAKLQNEGANYPPGTYRLEASYVRLDAKGQPIGEAILLRTDEFTLQANQ